VIGYDREMLSNDYQLFSPLAHYEASVDKPRATSLRGSGGTSRAIMLAVDDLGLPRSARLKRRCIQLLVRRNRPLVGTLEEMPTEIQD